MDKKTLSERDICTKFITPAIEEAGWDKQTQFLEEVSFTDGKIYVRGTLTARGARKRADYILYYKPNIPIAIIEAKDNNHSISAGIQQGLDYAQILDIPFVFSSNGDGFLFHDKTVIGNEIEKELAIHEFPSPNDLWIKYKAFKGIATSDADKIVSQDYYYDGTNRKPRYYQQIAINRTIEAIAKGENRILLVMATGTGKTYTAFQIIHRLWKSGTKKRILFLADRNSLIDQTKRGDFKHFKDKMTVVKHRMVDKSYEIYLALYQGLSGNVEESNIYKQFSPDFFDLIIVDECHRGSAKDDSAWREILDYFKKATQIGLTATPKETNVTSNSEYFGKPIYTYSLKKGIDDGFLAPYRVIRIGLDIDLEGWRPPKGFRDKEGNEVEDRIFNRTDFDKNIVVEERRALVARKISEFLKGYDRFAKTIYFATDIEHAENMTSLLRNENADIVKENYKYVMQITGDNDEGKRELDNFINPEERYPVIATTSELMTTGVDAQTCKVIVLDSEIRSMTKFKQIIGRGTRINEDFGKMFFTILDFRNVTDLFADSNFDGDPIRVKPIGQNDDITLVVKEEEENSVTVVDEESGEEIKFEKVNIRYPDGSHLDGNWIANRLGKREKVYVNGIDVSVLISRELYFDHNGKPITTSLKDHTREIIQGQYNSLTEFLNKWNATDRKEAIIKELQDKGVMVDALQESVNKEADLFDLICHVAFDQPPLTRKERANNVKKRNYFTKYGEQAKKVLETLLDKYADEGIENIESMDVLKVQPLTNFGSPIEIINEFGSKEKYLQAVKELENELYKSLNMVKSEFSETQFVVAYLREAFSTWGLLHHFYRWYMPSTVTKSRFASDIILKYGHGKYKYSLFYQFKRSSFYNSEIITDLSQNVTIDTGTNNMYGFKIYNTSITKQFNVLQSLARKNRTEVFYCAPLFHTISECRSHFRNSRVLDNSNLIDFRDASMQAITIPLDYSHRVIFDRANSYICSDVKEVKGYIASTKLAEIKHDVSKDSSEFFNEIVKHLQQLINEPLFENEDNNSKDYIENIYYLREALAAIYSIVWIPVFDEFVLK